MKIATLSLLTAIGGNPSARPAELKKDYCQDEFDKVSGGYNHCQFPGHSRKINLYQKKWYWFSSKKHDCKAKCCGGGNSQDGDNCKCIHAGKTHRNFDNWASTCCSARAWVDANGNPMRDEHGNPGFEVATDAWTGNNQTHCGCAYLGYKLVYKGAKESDCCSGKWDSDDSKTCIPGECVHSGGVPGDKKCCGYITGIADGTSTIVKHNDDGTCKCVPNGKELDTYQLSTATDCCSGTLLKGTVLGTNATCGCIADFKDPLPKGAAESDCCSGTTETNDQGVFCKAGSCSPKGQSAEGGAHCCSGVAGPNEECQCLLGGEAIPEGAGPSECCTSTSDGKCGFKGPGTKPSPYNAKKEVQCASNLTNAAGQCTCIKANVQPRDASITKEFCCSNNFTADGGQCSCVQNNAALITGADQSDCCSRTATGGVCHCAFAGRPAWSENSTGAECCSGYQIGGFCGCNEAGKHNLPAGSCCGGFKNATTDICTCIPDGTAVARFVRPEACCSGGIQNGTCTATSSTTNTTTR